MTTIHTLASGSSGNAALVSCCGVHVLLDAGISCRRIVVALRTLGVEPEELAAVFITHTHTDHIGGLQTFVKKYAVPVYASRRTCAGLAYRIAGIEPLLRPFADGETISLDGLTVTGGELTLAGDASIDRGEVHISGGTVSFEHGLWLGEGDIVITGGTVIVPGGEAGLTAENGKVTISGGTVHEP